MFNGKRYIAISLFTLSALVLFALGSASPTQAKDFKAAIVLPGVITDKSANQSGYEGMLQAKERLGISVAYSEKVGQPDQAEALADYARRGYAVVLGMGGEFQDAADRVAVRYPKTMFVVINGINPSANVACLRFKDVDSGYVLGYLAGKMSKTGVAAYIGAQQIAFTLDQQKDFSNGFKAANPNGKVLTAWTSDWDDIAKGKEAALTCISQGADAIYPTMDNAIVGSFQAAKEHGKWAFGIYYDHFPEWPDTILQSAVMHWSQAIFRILSIAHEGKLEGKEYLIGFEEPKAMSLGTFNPAVPEATRLEIQSLIEDIKSGKVDTSK